jgi:intermediate cleaving peptidase 55
MTSNYSSKYHGLTRLKAGDIARIGHELPKLLKGVDKIYTDLPRSVYPKTQFSRFISSLPLRPTDGISKFLPGPIVKPLRPLLNELRVRKSEAEVALMRKVGKASGRAITTAMRESWTGEKQLAARLEYGFLEHEMDGVGYVPVVAGGTNALNIHYTRNDSLLE